MAMAGNIRVTPEQQQGIAGQLNSGASNIESINSQLQSQVAPLGSDWAGVAQARFHEPGPSGNAPAAASKKHYTASANS
jgi:uncharacterized protein YukE